MDNEIGSSARRPVTETTPLLKNLSDAARANTTVVPSKKGVVPSPAGGGSHHDGKLKSKSTFLQSLFNMSTMLLGLGMLAKPFAFAKAGWVCGSLLLVFYGAVACYTARIVGHIGLSDPTLVTYPEIARRAFGGRPRYVGLARAAVCVTMFSFSVVYIILYATSIQPLLPYLTLTQYKVIGLLIFIPTVFLPLRWLAYPSFIGMLSVFLVIFVLLFDGIANPTAPGSLRDPLATDWFPPGTNLGGIGFQGIGLTAGLFMAGLAGHAIIPEIARDMQNPKQFDLMIVLTFAIVTSVSGIIGIAGYLMFGRDVSGEVSLDLLHTSWPNRSSEILNRIMTWSLVVTPLTKFAVEYRPVNVIIENYLFPPTPTDAPTLEAQQQQQQQQPSAHRASVHKVYALQRRIDAIPRPLAIASLRVGLTSLAVAFSILLPSFASTVAFLGAFGATLLSVHGPICAKIALVDKGKVGWVDAFILAVVSVLSVWGTIEAFKSEKVGHV